jgi:hypothetical protein
MRFSILFFIITLFLPGALTIAQDDTIPGTFEGEISYGDTKRGNLTTNQWVFTGQADDIIQVEIRTTLPEGRRAGPDPTIRIYGPDGLLLTQSLTYVQCLVVSACTYDTEVENGIKDFLLPTSGQYTIVVARNYRFIESRYALSLALVRSGAETASLASSFAEEFVPANADLAENMFVFGAMQLVPYPENWLLQTFSNGSIALSNYEAELDNAPSYGCCSDDDLLVLIQGFEEQRLIAEADGIHPRVAFLELAEQGEFDVTVYEDGDTEIIVVKDFNVNAVVLATLPQFSIIAQIIHADDLPEAEAEAYIQTVVTMLSRSRPATTEEAATLYEPVELGQDPGSLPRRLSNTTFTLGLPGGALLPNTATAMSNMQLSLSGSNWQIVNPSENFPVYTFIVAPADAPERGLEIAYGEVTPSGFAGVVINSIDVVNIDGRVALRTQATNTLTDTSIYTLSVLLENGEIASLSAWSFTPEFDDSLIATIHSVAASIETVDSSVRNAQLGDNAGTLPVGSFDLWGYDAQAGETLTITTEADWDTVLVLGDADNELLASNDDDNDLPNYNSRIVYTFDTAGSYRILVRSFENRSGGDYILRLEAGD